MSLLQVLNSVLRDLYRLLKRVSSSERDEVVKLHVIMALEELNIVMEQFLFPPQTLEKRISVTRSPNVDLGF